jgi:hypothetical protein
VRQRAIVAHAGMEMGSWVGIELNYDSKSEDYHDDMNNTNYKW